VEVEQQEVTDKEGDEKDRPAISLKRQWPSALAKSARPGRFLSAPGRGHESPLFRARTGGTYRGILPFFMVDIGCFLLRWSTCKNGLWIPQSSEIPLRVARLTRRTPGNPVESVSMAHARNRFIIAPGE